MSKIYSWKCMQYNNYRGEYLGSWSLSVSTELTLLAGCFGFFFLKKLWAAVI